MLIVIKFILLIPSLILSFIIRTYLSRSSLWCSCRKPKEWRSSCVTCECCIQWFSSRLFLSISFSIIRDWRPLLKPGIVSHLKSNWNSEYFNHYMCSSLQTLKSFTREMAQLYCNFVVTLARNGSKQTTILMSKHKNRFNRWTYLGPENISKYSFEGKLCLVKYCWNFTQLTLSISFMAFLINLYEAPFNSKIKERYLLLLYAWENFVRWRRWHLFWWLYINSSGPLLWKILTIEKFKNRKMRNSNSKNNKKH